jgi:hypothetical protein
MPTKASATKEYPHLLLSAAVFRVVLAALRWDPSRVFRRGLRAYKECWTTRVRSATEIVARETSFVQSQGLQAILVGSAYCLPIRWPAPRTFHDILPNDAAARLSPKNAFSQNRGQPKRSPLVSENEKLRRQNQLLQDGPDKAHIIIEVQTKWPGCYGIRSLGQRRGAEKGASFRWRQPADSDEFLLAMRYCLNKRAARAG